jgi:hypothetical protein
MELLRSQLGPLSERDWQRIEAAMRSLTNKIAREPILRLKRAAEDAPVVPDAEAIRYDLHAAALELFGLETSTANEAAAVPETSSSHSAEEAGTLEPTGNNPVEKPNLSVRRIAEANR